jgi:N-acetylmuramoyl-L-alanine amidase
MTIRTGVLILAGAMHLAGASSAAAQPARDLYTRALGRERAVRNASTPASAQHIRNVIAAYERVVRRYPTSGYSDNALWQAGNLALLAYERFGEEADRKKGVRLLTLLRSEYPASSLGARVRAAIAESDRPRTAAAPVHAISTPATIEEADLPTPAADRTPAPAAPADVEPVAIRTITRTALDDVVRVSIEMDRELLFHQERLENPSRVFFDLKGALPSPGLISAPMKFSDDVVREIRLGRHPQNTTRVVLDTDGVESYSVFTLYNPFRVIVDFRRSAAPAHAPAASTTAPVAVSTTGPSRPEPRAVGVTSTPASAPLPSRPLPAPDLPAPAVPSVNSNGQFSIARQLGLGVSRIVLDPGHGGHDPGANANGLNEADLTLDVAIRLRKLLDKEPGVEVVMTREKNVYIPLEERTAIANREGADLFLSIHANASRNGNARGVETYFLNFATNPEAEAVAARENSASGRSMHSLPDIVRAIALNNKIDESRDFASAVQKAMVRRLSARNKQLRDLGVKQAPFVVLIGAGMPSVLAEISFVTHKQEGQLLKTSAYRQTIAEALLDAILRYQKSLKSKNAIASREGVHEP